MSPSRSEFPDPGQASAWVKGIAQQLGANQVGITYVNQEHVYKDETLEHEFAIVVAVALSHVERPTEFTDGWRMRVKAKEPGG